MKGRRALSGRGALLATWVATRTFGAVSTRLGGALASRLWFTPWRVDPDERTRRREREWLAATRPIEVEAGGARLRGWDVGDGPTVLLVHGWGDRAASLGATIEPLVTSGFRVVGVDLPAHGDSPSGPTDLYSLADAVRTIADQFAPRAVIAHSMGGPVALLAARDGMRLDAVVLIAAAVRLEHALAPFQRMFRLPERAMDGLHARIEERFGPDVWRDVAADRLGAALDLPALVIHDLTDAQVRPDDARLLVDAWHDAELVITEGLGHTRILRDPDVTARIASFLRQHVTDDTATSTHVPRLGAGRHGR